MHAQQSSMDGLQEIFSTLKDLVHISKAVCIAAVNIQLHCH